ncbi:hypothetical protein [Streptomyces meridianus]|uniref:Uncharacterized protein n=1 Tax=Streptomyces meridianus TaxID=2938945 RepID=A0ABT0X6W4_9ACTN|nr:hypothetical protein [Streptomyces meridianus]MCM2578045.1 hypothetical protein [Streptomyces meridianus]
MAHSILPSRYRVPSKLIESIALTDSGEELCKRLMRIRNFKWPEVRLACFLKFSHHELLVDHNKTDLTELISALNEEIEAGKILHPFIWGRELYDKAFEVFQHDPVSVDELQTAELLEGTPRGVWQSADVTTGPLGIIFSQEMRALIPIVEIPLYHCEKRTCRTVHRTYLATTDSQIHKTRAKLREILEKEWEPPSAFPEFFTDIDNEICDYYGDQRCLGEIPLLGECFSSEELDAIITIALKGKGAPLRLALRENSINVGDPQAFIEGLDKAGKIQALILMKSKQLTTCIDEAVHTKQIKIPAHEIRRPKILDISTGFYNLSAECSRYGVRTMPEDRSLAVVRLRRLIVSIYDLSDPSCRSELGWRLRRIDGESVEEKLDRYVRNADPADVLSNLVLVGPTSFSAAADRCGVPRTMELERLEDAELVNILLWKLGFSLKDAEDAFGPLRRNRDAFSQAVGAITAYSESERYEIKRESSPLFSSIESALDATLSFTAWALTFDHWSAQSRFTYYHADAREQMAKVLNSAQARPTATVEAVIYDSQGRNTLFPLISGFSRLRAYLANVLAHADQYLRPESEMPSYATHADLTPFAFTHTLPFLSLSKEAQQEIIELLSEMTRVLEGGQVSSIRNKLQHSRDDFPSKDELNRFLESVGKFLEIAEGSGLCPVLFRPVGHHRDASGRSSYSFSDYRSREHVIHRPSSIGNTGMPGLLKEQFIIPVAKVSKSTEVLRFSVGTHSTYNELWQDWPRYRATADRRSELMHPTDEAAQAG